MAKPKLALYWASSCGGCEIAVVDIEAKILDVAGFFDIVFWPCIMDFKYKDVEALPDGDITVCLFNGAIRTSENEYMAKLLRAKSKVMVHSVHVQPKDAFLLLPTSMIRKQSSNMFMTNVLRWKNHQKVYIPKRTHKCLKEKSRYLNSGIR